MSFRDGPTTTHDLTLPVGDTGPLLTREFVVDDILLPTSDAESKKYGFDFDHDGKVDNALGAVVAAVQGLSSRSDLAGDLRLSVAKGSTILLIRVFASNFTDHVGTTGRYFVGQDVACCATTNDLATCQAEARASCFSGSASFERETSQLPSELKGSISAAQLTLGAKSVPIAIALSGARVLLTLSGAVLQGRLEPDGSISGGTLAGGISQEQIDTVLLPELAQLVTAEIQDPNTSQSTRDQLTNLFDSDRDGTVTVAELTANSLVAQLIKPDVDVDGDGKRDLSLGVGFTAVGAMIR